MNPQPKPVTEVNLSRVKWVKTKPCLFAPRDNYDGVPVRVLMEMISRECEGPMDPHHVVPIGGAKTGKKTDDSRTVPACRLHHEWIAANQHLQHVRVWLERTIRDLNTEYDALHKPVKRVRQASMKATLHIVHCEMCHGTHNAVPLSKLQVSDSSLTFRCVKSNRYASLRVK